MGWLGAGCSNWGVRNWRHVYDAHAATAALCNTASTNCHGCAKAMLGDRAKYTGTDSYARHTNRLRWQQPVSWALQPVHRHSACSIPAHPLHTFCCPVLLLLLLPCCHEVGHLVQPCPCVPWHHALLSDDALNQAARGDVKAGVPHLHDGGGGRQQQQCGAGNSSNPCPLPLAAEPSLLCILCSLSVLTQDTHYTVIIPPSLPPFLLPPSPPPPHCSLTPMPSTTTRWPLK